MEGKTSILFFYTFAFLLSTIQIKEENCMMDYQIDSASELLLKDFSNVEDLMSEYIEENPLSFADLCELSELIKPQTVGRNIYKLLERG